MSRKVLIINVTRMGDLIQTGPLLSRLRHEWPDVAIDVVVDRQFGAMAAMLPAVRHVHAYDFERLLSDCRAMSRDVVCLYQDMKAWAAPLAAERYDRVVNLTFTRRSGLLAAYLRAPDVRGAVSAPDGSTTIGNPWLAYFTDLHRYRRFNRFNLVDLYALGGSGEGPFAPLSLTVSSDASAWASALLGKPRPAHGWVAVQVGASEVIKAWRPAYFAQTMATLGRRLSVGFVMIGTASEQAAVREALQVYRQLGGAAPVVDAVQRTDLARLTALLSRCNLLLTNDTGPMHMAVAVGTKVVDLSVGHVDFRETGPYGRGHWVVQPDLHCAPCGFDQVCAHQACKDRVDPYQVAALCAHVLGHEPCPGEVTGARLFESVVGDDQLVTYRQRAGRIDAIADWYGRWWKRFWHAEFTGRPLVVGVTKDTAPDWSDQARVWAVVEPVLVPMRRRLGELERVAGRMPIAARELHTIHRSLADMQQHIARATEGSAAFGPLTIALWRELANDDSMTLSDMAMARRRAFMRWSERIQRVVDHLQEARVDQTEAARVETAG